MRQTAPAAGTAVAACCSGGRIGQGRAGQSHGVWATLGTDSCRRAAALIAWFVRQGSNEASWDEQASAIVALCSPTAQAFLALAHLGPCCASRPASSSPCRHEASSIGALPLSTCVRRPAWGIRVREPYLPALRTAPSKTAPRRTNTSKKPKTHLLNNLPAGGSAQPPAPPALLGPAAAPALLGRRPAPRSGRQPAPAPAQAARRCLGGRVAGLPPLCMPQRVLQPHFQPPLLPSKLALVLLAGQRWCGWHRRHCCCNQARCQCG